MGFLDRIKASLGRPSAEAEASGPHGPLALAVGDVVRHYANQWVVSGIRALDGSAGSAHHYCLRDESGAWAVLAVAAGSPSYWLERSVELPPPGDVVKDVAHEPLRRTGEASYRCRTIGDTDLTPSRTVRVEIFEDEQGESRLVVESHGGVRTARLGESVFEGEIAFGEESAAAEQRPWAAVAVGTCDDTTNDGMLDTDDGAALGRMPKGTPNAAAAALEGRLARGESLPAPRRDVVDVDDEREGYADDDWADAQDEGPAPQRFTAAHHSDGDESSHTSDDWLQATRFVAGADAPPRVEHDDWLSD